MAESVQAILGARTVISSPARQRILIDRATAHRWNRPCSRNSVDGGPAVTYRTNSTPTANQAPPHVM